MWLTWQQAVLLAAILAAAGFALRPVVGRWAMAGAMAREASLVLVLYAVWQYIGALRTTRLDDGLVNGRKVWDFERAIHIANEVDIERWFLDHPALVHAANGFYAIVHVPALIIFLVWLFAWHRPRYARLRNLVAAVTAISLFMHWIPVAPPRFYPELGFVDVARQYGESVYGPVGQGLSDQVSAMPSLHAAWAIIVGVGAVTVSRSRWRWLVLAHPVLTALVIVATANHWWLDTIVAGIIVAVVMGAQWAIAIVRSRFGADEADADVEVDGHREPESLAAPGPRGTAEAGGDGGHQTLTAAD